jgi:hypothetical protein
MEAGTWLVVASAVVAISTALVLRTRLPAWFVLALLAGSGAGVGWGGMLLRADPSAGEAIAAVAGLAILVPAHVRIVIGSFGPGARGIPWRAAATTEQLRSRSEA